MERKSPVVATYHVLPRWQVEMTKEPVQYSDDEAEIRTTEALRRALTTPYKPQRELVGKRKRVTSTGKAERLKSAPKAPEGGEA